jgi:hypothetical protein
VTADQARKLKSSTATGGVLSEQHPRPKRTHQVLLVNIPSPPGEGGTGRRPATEWVCFPRWDKHPPPLSPAGLGTPPEGGEWE